MRLRKADCEDTDPFRMQVLQVFRSTFKKPFSPFTGFSRLFRPETAAFRIPDSRVTDDPASSKPS